MGAILGGNIRSESHGTDVESARRAVADARGDKVELVVARLDDDGRPTGNRQERRLAQRMLRRSK